MCTKIRKWRYSAAVDISPDALAKACFSVGNSVERAAKEGEITLTRAAYDFILQDLLKKTSTEAIALDNEDIGWLDDTSRTGTWDAWFDTDEGVTDDFMDAREQPDDQRLRANNW